MHLCRGLVIRDMHANGASMFLVVLYIHLFCGLCHGCHASPRGAGLVFEVIACLGVQYKYEHPV